MNRITTLLAAGLTAFGHAAVADHAAPITRDDIVRNLADSELEGQELDGAVFRIQLGKDRTLVWRKDGKVVRQGRWRVTDDARYCDRWQGLKERCASVQIERDLVIMAPPIGTALTIVAGRRAAGSVTATMHRISSDGIGSAIGTIRFRPVPGGLELHPNLAGLSPGPHAFHIHENPDCGSAHKHGQATAGLAAGGHLDYPTAPANGKDSMAMGGMTMGSGPHGRNMPEPAAPHKMAGDLPEIHFDTAGKATAALKSPRPDFHDLFGRAVMIHAHGENPPDRDKAKGGGARVACGVIPR